MHSLSRCRHMPDVSMMPPESFGVARKPKEDTSQEYRYRRGQPSAKRTKWQNLPGSQAVVVSPHNLHLNLETPGIQLEA